MTFIGIVTALTIGILTLIAGIITKRKWLMVFSTIPSAIAIFQLALLFTM